MHWTLEANLDVLSQILIIRLQLLGFVLKVFTSFHMKCIFSFFQNWPFVNFLLLHAMFVVFAYVDDFKHIQL